MFTRPVNEETDDAEESVPRGQDDPLSEYVDCWENQRYVIFRGWGPYRLPTDRPLWSSRKGDERRHLESFLLPQGCSWESDWYIFPAEVLASGNGTTSSISCSTRSASSGSSLVISDPAANFGWLYAADFTVPTKYCSLKASPLTLVRRRRWVRQIRRMADDVTAATSSGRDEGHLSQPSYWSQAMFYGFTATTGTIPAAVVASEALRQHESFHRLAKLCRLSFLEQMATTNGLARSIGQVNTQPEKRASQSTASKKEPDDDDGSGDESTPAATATTVIMPGPAAVSSKILHYVYKYGVAQRLRREIWALWTFGGTQADGRQMRRDSSLLASSSSGDLTVSYSTLAALAAQSSDTSPEAIEIAQDVVRTAPRHPLFEGRGSVGNNRLRALLLTLSLTPSFPGYFQAFSYLGALMLLVTSPEEAYYILLFIFDVLLPQGYHERFMVQHDVQIFDRLLQVRQPVLAQHFSNLHIDVSVFASGWLQGLLAAHFPFSSAARVVDIMLAEQSSTCYVRFLLAFTKFHERALLSMDSSCSLGLFANEWARQAWDIQPILDIMESDRLSAIITEERRLHQVSG